MCISFPLGIDWCEIMVWLLVVVVSWVGAVGLGGGLRLGGPDRLTMLLGLMWWFLLNTYCFLGTDIGGSGITSANVLLGRLPSKGRILF